MTAINGMKFNKREGALVGDEQSSTPQRKYDTAYITLYKAPYTKKDVISRTKWNVKDVTITDVTPKFEGEE